MASRTECGERTGPGRRLWPWAAGAGLPGEVLANMMALGQDSEKLGKFLGK